MLTECRKIYTVARACSATCNNGPLIIRDSPAPLLACKLRKSSNAALYRVQANIRERESRKTTEHDRTNRASCNSKEKTTKKESTKKKEEVEWNNEEHEEVEE